MDDNISIDVLSLNSDHEDTDDDGDEPTTQATYDGSSLYKLLKPKLNAKITNDKKEINILLLGQTGVGKSTFINAFANYLSYETIDEALRGETMCLIPCSFATYDDEMNPVNVTLGKDENEVLEEGESATQQSRCFSFLFGERLIRLIDTPGLGDTRGNEQDQVNFENILDFIGQYDCLHCICILLKPTETRLTIYFEYVLNQILSRLQVSASKNIVFVFTNTRGTFFRPGETGVNLTELLGKIKKKQPAADLKLNRYTQYCMDNEAFRYIIAAKQGVSFPEPEIRSYTNSWTTSANQCLQLMQYIIGTDGEPGLTPHPVRATLSINVARKLIATLSEPLGEIGQNIDDNLQLIHEHRKEIENIGDNFDKLKTKLFIPQFEIVVNQLDEPQTVCASEKCRTIYIVHGIQKLTFEKKCHDKCSVYGIQREILEDRRIKSCRVFKWYNLWLKCTKCGCSWKEHKHIYTETKLIERHEIDKEVKSKLEQIEDIKVLKQEMLKQLNKTGQELEGERKFIIETTAKFAKFIKENSIAPFSDIFQAYLKYSIDNSKSLLNKNDKNDKSVKNLEKMLNEYEIVKRSIDQSKDTKAITLEEVFALIPKLFELKHYGKKIKEMKDKNDSARQREHCLVSKEVKCNPMNRRVEVTQPMSDVNDDPKAYNKTFDALYD